MRLLDPQSPEVEVGIRRLNSAKIRFPDTPTDIELYFGLHGSAEDLDPNFGDTLEEADIFALEQVGWAPETRELTQRLANGDEGARKELEVGVTGFQKEFWYEMHRSIFDTKVVIHNPDVPRGHALALQHDRATNEAGTAYGMLGVREMIGAPIPEAEIVNLTDRLFSIYNKREKYILEHFFPKEMPEVEHLKVVGFFGILHRGIAPILARHAARNGRDDITVSVRETSGSPPQAYEDFLQQLPLGLEDRVAFLTHRMD
jgi:hypothetical protein